MMFRSNKQKGFTIVELLTVMSIIIILISVLVPALGRVRRFAKVVTQKGQFHEISKGLELYRTDHRDTLPESSAVDTNTPPTLYCGAMKLCEALLGQDGMGNHPLSSFNAEQYGTYVFNLYHCVILEPSHTDYPPLVPNLQERVRYIDSENVRATPIQYLYNWDITSTAGAQSYFNPAVTFKNTMPNYPNSIIGDVFQRAIIQGSATLGCPQKAGQKVGMPVLYYKADPSKLSHDTLTDSSLWGVGNPYPNIYNFDDNYGITALGCSWESTYSTEHPMFTDPRVFLKAITNEKVTTMPRPHNEDGYILMSAGWDGLYGTSDDVFNFAD